MQKHIGIDEEGYFLLDNGVRLQEKDLGQELLRNLTIKDNLSIETRWDNEAILVEAFDKPLVATNLHTNPTQLILDFPYDFSAGFSLETLCRDDWGRLHGLTDNKIPFVLSRAAQATFLQIVDVRAPNHFLFQGKTYALAPFYITDAAVSEESFWTGRYLEENLPPWDLAGPHPALEPILPQLKLLKSRIINFGCGRGHDAHFLAQKGHIVTGVDVSPTAIDKAQQLYQKPTNLHFLQEDVFQSSHKADVIFEHTLFCAIPPEKRKDLIRVWKNTLEDTGYLLGIFFVMAKRSGPPYGASEWELRELLEPHFRLMYWKRWPHSPPSRQGNELVVFAQKR